MAEAPAGKPPRKRPPPRRTNVRRIERVTPRMIRVTFAGEELEGFGPPKPGGHMKLFFPENGWDPKNPDSPRPPSRTYTPRRYDPAEKALEVEFVLHGEGLAADWVRKAREGDELYLAGPGGGYEVPPDARNLVLVADDTAMPAAGTILEAMPPQCEALILCEVADPTEERVVSGRGGRNVQWLHLDGAQAGTLLEREVKRLAATEGAYWWVACESGAMRRIRTHLLKERAIDPKLVHTRGYWRLGETNYPDHDYGAD